LITFTGFLTLGSVWRKGQLEEIVKPSDLSIELLLSNAK
jgi:hypothetical protein